MKMRLFKRALGLPPRGYAKYIKNISAKFPQTAEAWQQTYKEVSGAFPDQ